MEARICPRKAHRSRCCRSWTRAEAVVVDVLVQHHAGEVSQVLDVRGQVVNDTLTVPGIDGGPHRLTLSLNSSITWPMLSWRPCRERRSYSTSAGGRRVVSARTW